MHCLSCHSENLHRIRRYKNKTSHGKTIFRDSWINECGDCGLTQAYPRPTLDALSDYYAVDYREGCCAGKDVSDAGTFPKDNLFYYNRGQSIADLIAPHVVGRTPRVLDIGAGFGHILHAIGTRIPGSRRLAIEFSQVCVEHLQSMGIEVYNEPADTMLENYAGRFEVVILSHVFEHLLDPVKILDLVRERLEPGGLLYVEVPNIPRHAHKQHPDHVWAPRFDEPHITFFSHEVLREQLERAQFQPFYCETAGPEYRYVSALRYRMPTMRWLVQGLVPTKLFHFLRRQAFTWSVRVKEREEEFYETGGLRIWLRSLSRVAS